MQTNFAIFVFYVAKRVYGIPAHLRKSLLAPGISPNESIVVIKVQGMVITLFLFALSKLIFVLPSAFLYPLLNALLVGSVTGSVVDYLWAFSMIFSK